jgi:hypothetical protein
MSDGLPKLKYLGSYEGGSDCNIIVPRAAFERVEQSFAAEREIEARALAAKAAEVERAKVSTRGMRLARAARRFKRALRMFRRMRR